MRKVLAIVSCACAVGLTSSTDAGSGPAGRFGGNAEFLIWRAPDFGTEMFLIVAIDGVQIAALPKGNGYRAIVVPGRHVLTVRNSPSPYGKTRGFSRDIVLRPGECSAFSATWDSDHLVFEDASESVVRHRLEWSLGH